MAGLDLTAYNYALETMYPSGIESLVFEDNVLAAMLPKAKNFFGKDWAIEIKYGDTTGRSATLARAIANVGAHSGVRFLVTRKKDYAYGVLDRETLKASQHDPGAAASALEMEMESLVNKARNSLGAAVWGTGSGSLGQVGAFTGTTVTLLVPDDVVKFEKGDFLCFSSADGGGSLRASGAAIQVTGVDRDNGILTFAATAPITSLAVNDYLFVDGDYDAKVNGVLGWVPKTNPTSTAWFGVDRTADLQRLGGIRVNGSTLPKDEALVIAAARIRRDGGKPGHAFMNPMDAADLQNVLGTRVIYEEVEAAGIGFTATLVKTPGGIIKVFEDRNCPRGYSLVTDLSSWELNTLGDLYEFVDEDGNKLLRRSGTDDFEVRVATYGNLGNKRPGHSVLLSLS